MRQAGRRERLRRYWDRHAGSYDKQMGFFDRHLFSGSRDWVCSRATGRVLEVAIGTGLNFAHYPEEVQLTGVDQSPAMLDIARRRAAGAQPVPDIGGDRRRQQREPFPRQGGEGGDPVVMQEPGEAEDLGGAGDAQVPGVQGRRQRGPCDHVSGLVAGEDDGQCPAGLNDDPRVPAAGPGQFGGDVPGLLQGLIGDGRCDPVGLAEVQGFTGNRQLQLCPSAGQVAGGVRLPGPRAAG